VTFTTPDASPECSRGTADMIEALLAGVNRPRPPPNDGEAPDDRSRPNSTS
jgi:hypothetical protein